MNAHQMHNLEILMALLQKTEGAILHDVAMAQIDIPAAAAEDQKSEKAEKEEEPDVVEALEDGVIVDVALGKEADILDEYVESVLLEMSSGRFNSNPGALEILNLHVGHSLDDLAERHDTVSSYNIKFNSSALLSVLISEQSGGHHNDPSYENKDAPYVVTGPMPGGNPNGPSGGGSVKVSTLVSFDEPGGDSSLLFENILDNGNDLGDFGNVNVPPAQNFNPGGQMNNQPPVNNGNVGGFGNIGNNHNINNGMSINAGDLEMM